MGGRFKIDGWWCDPPKDTPIKNWLNEIVGVAEFDFETLEPTRYVFRWQIVERIRPNGKGRGKSIEEIREWYKNRKRDGRINKE